MTETAAPSAVVPFHDPSRPRRLVKVTAWLVGIALANARTLSDRLR